MVSTRESSPGLSSPSSSPAILTPKSKLKALMAQYDDDSEDEAANGGSARERLLAAMQKSEAEQKENAVDSTIKLAKGANAPGIEADSDEDEEDIAKPKGRMAARMQVNAESSDEEAASNGKRNAISTKENSPEPTPNAEVSEKSDESDTPVVSRKRKVRVPRKAIPQPSPAKSAGSPASPGLFVSPTKIGSPVAGDNASDSDDLPEMEIMTNNPRFQALVARKRAERLAEEAEREKEKARRAAERKKRADFFGNDKNLDSDEEDGHRLTQQTRVPRKASKRALEEMNRETQRMSRNQQLAYNPTVKKKVNKSSLFAKFNFKPKYQPEDESEPARPTSSSSAAHHIDQEMKSTPPSSPPTHPADVEKSMIPVIAPPTVLDAGRGESDTELPTLEDLRSMRSSPPVRLDKGKGKAVEIAEPTPEPQVEKKPKFTQRPIRVRPPKPEDRGVSVMDDSDSDLEIVTRETPIRRKLDAMFDRVPAKQSREANSMYALRMLAHLESPKKQRLGRNTKPSISTAELAVDLQQRARQQAARVREERLQELKARGIVIQTAEEREREAAEVDDILSKARQEVEELGKREKAAHRKERKERGEASLMDDSSDDEDWEEEKAEPVEEAVLSGSDDEDESGSGEDASEEDEEAMEIDDDAQEAAAENPMFDNEAAEGDDDEADAELSADEEMVEYGDADDDDEDLPVIHNARKPRKSNIISDDEDESEDEKQTPTLPHTDSPKHPNTDSPIAPKSVLRSATKTFIPGVTVAGPAGLSLTQIFAGTMDESQMSPTAMESESQDPKNDPLNFLRRQPAPTLPPFVPTMAEDTQDLDMVNQSQVDHIPESQPETQAQDIQIHFSQSQMHGFDSFVTDSQLSQLPDATQDMGFAQMTPIKGRFDGTPSTVETMVLEPGALPETLEETPIVKKKGKLRRRAQIASFSDEEDNLDPAPMAVEEETFDLDNVFDTMRKASKKKIVVNEFDKKKSGAKEMVNEQAEESEDEYAGLGGASDDESGGEEDTYVKEMIDDEAGKDANERELAAFFADRERAADEKAVEKLYNDVTKGMLRRKRGGADYDLSDSDDGGEARQKRKRKEFAKMRKALLSDERLGKLASDPRRESFLRTIEDRGSGDEMDFLGDFADQEPETDSQSQSQAEVIPNSQSTEMGPPKRKRDDAQAPENRLPPHLRRTKPAKKPANLSEIRESLSSLIEEPNSMLAAPESDSGSEDELEIVEGEDLGSGPREKNKENRDPFALRRSNITVVDRISLKRSASSTTSASSRLAFATSSSTPGFKVPPLLRRATTNNSIASSTSSSVSGTERMAGGEEKGGVKRGGVRGSGVNAFAARESERRAAVVKTEKRREQKLVKGAQVRRKVVGGMFGGGKFE